MHWSNIHKYPVVSIVCVYSIVHIYIHCDTGHLRHYTFTGTLGCLVNFSACEQGKKKKSHFFILKEDQQYKTSFLLRVDKMLHVLLGW